MCLIPLHNTLKMVKMVDFMLFSHSVLNSGKYLKDNFYIFEKKHYTEVEKSNSP